ncbi:hypothetical protein C8J56DRAFT_944451 [Mycena floridula]|nr:hypothetical protein C8J56DRAFT_944451 [Mycena floridula]
MPVHSLPQELVDHIIDHLHGDPSLLSCSLVCRAWLPSSRLHLFAKICLQVPRDPVSDAPQTATASVVHPDCSRLYELLSKSPELIQYIQDICICSGPAVSVSRDQGPVDTSEPSLIDSDDQGMVDNWIMAEKSLPPLLLMLTHLKKLELSAQNSVSWETLPCELKNAIEAMFRLPSLTFVRLRRWDFADLHEFTRLVTQSPNLKGLGAWSIGLGKTAITNDEEDSEVGDSEIPDHLELYTGPHLEFLTLDYVDLSHLGDWLIGRPTTLRELRVAHSSDATIGRLLRSLDSALEHFHLKSRASSSPIDLSRNTGLRSLRLTLDEDTRALEWTCEVLSGLTEPGRLERLAIEIYILPRELDGWERIENLLVRPEFAGLQQVEIGIFAKEFQDVEAKLTNLKARGILHIYQLGTKSHKLRMSLPPMISRYED